MPPLITFTLTMPLLGVGWISFFQNFVFEPDHPKIELVNYSYEGTYTAAHFTLPQVDSPDIQASINKRLMEFGQRTYTNTPLPLNESEFKETYSKVESFYTDLPLENKFADEDEERAWIEEAKQNRNLKLSSDQIHTEILSAWPNLVSLRVHAVIESYTDAEGTHKAFITFDPTTGQTVDIIDVFKPEALRRIFSPIYAKLDKYRLELAHSCDFEAVRVNAMTITPDKLLEKVKGHFGIKVDRVVFEAEMSDIPLPYEVSLIGKNEEIYFEIPYSFSDLNPKYRPPLLERVRYHIKELLKNDWQRKSEKRYGTQHLMGR